MSFVKPAPPASPQTRPREGLIPNLKAPLREQPHEVWHQPLGELGHFARITRPPRIPEVLSRAEVQWVLAAVEADQALPLKLLYGSGLRLS